MIIKIIKLFFVSSILLFISCKEENPTYLDDLLFSPKFEIEITNPVAGSTVYTNIATQIRWTTNNNVSKVTIKLLKNSEQFLLAENIDNSGIYIWNVNENLPEGEDYKIAIYNISDNKLLGRMNGTFRIQKHPFLLTLPNGGETWYTGRTYDITWSQNLSGSSNYINIELWFNGSFHSTIATNISANQKSYQWQIPKDLTNGTLYKIKIILTKDLNIFDYSNDFLTIKTAQFKFQFPLNDVILYTGHKYPIFWSKPDGYSYYFTVELYRSNTKISTIKDNFSSKYGAISFDVNAGLTNGNDYKIKIINNTTSETITSNYFTISSGTYNNGNTSSYEPNNSETSSYGPLLPNIIYSSYLNSSVDQDWFNIDVPNYSYVKFFISNYTGLNYGFRFKESTGLSSYYTEMNTFHFLGGNYIFEIYSSNGEASLTVPYYFIFVYD